MPGSRLRSWAWVDRVLGERGVHKLRTDVVQFVSEAHQGLVP
jgi:hypothetical protein